MKGSGVILVVIGLIVVFGFMIWAVADVGGVGALFGRTADVNFMIGFGVVGVAVLAGVLMRLAFISSRRGFDEPVQFEKREDDEA
jgi:hypothetical protein